MPARPADRFSTAPEAGATFAVAGYLATQRFIPLVVAVGPANQRDEEFVKPMLKQFPPVRGRDGKWRRKPKVLQGDRGYGFPYIVKLLVRLVIGSLLAMRGSPHGSGLGKTRYVIERWLG
jgi:hypothetical protein